jgi:O-acetyl-ADP-ribose deacetylase (regulator of RNase III)
MKPITYLEGDATNPKEVKGNKILVHCCNNLGLMGAGIAKTIRDKWPDIYKQYKEWSKEPDFGLGKVQLLKADNDLVIGNMIGQEGIGFTNGKPPIRYDAIDSCLKRVAEVIKKQHSVISVIAPKFGAGLAGGDWSEIEKLIIKNLCEQDIPVYIYDFKKE